MGAISRMARRLFLWRHMVSLKYILFVSCFLFGECEFAVYVYFLIVWTPRTVRWVARWKNDIKKAWQDEEPDHFK